MTNGVATYTGCAYTIASATAYTLTASSGGLTSATATTSVSAGTPTKLVYTTAPPAATTAGATFTVVVAEQDAFGNTESATPTTTLAPGGQQRRRRVLLHDHPDARDQRRRDLHGLQVHGRERDAYTLTASSAGSPRRPRHDGLRRRRQQARLHDRRRRPRRPRARRSRVVVAEQDALGNTETGDSADGAHARGRTTAAAGSPARRRRRT